jgi:threonyl-tRNA synthetase
MESDLDLDPALDHRNLGSKLDLFHFQDEAPGMVFWHPRGFALYRLLEEAARRAVDAAGYREVRTPQVLRRAIWEASGHWQHFRDGMFRLEGEGVRQGAEAALKPVSCPGHVQIARRAAPSFRDLPMRLAEFGLVHRDEPSGTLHGLLRLRQFTQDDGHVFCSEAQAEDEVERFCRSVAPFYRAFGFERLSVVLSLRPDDRAGDDALWDHAEAALAAVVGRLGVPHEVQPKGGAFYGPKLEFVLHDRLGRAWQCGTIQFDLVMPRRFDLRYVDSGGERRHVVMLHRALFGSLERFLGMLLEHHGGALPAWLAPEQIAVLPVAPEHAAWGEQVGARLRAAGLRAKVVAPSESLGRRIAASHEGAIPFAAIVGAREVAAGGLTLRARGGGGAQRALALEEAVAELAAQCAAPS